MKTTVWLPSENSCGDVTSGTAVTVACSLSVAFTGAQVTVALVLPLSAMTVFAGGQVSPNEGRSVSLIKNKIQRKVTIVITIR